MVHNNLSLNQKNIIRSWSSNKDKPLFITGPPGCGKSSLANHLLKEYHIVHINSDHIKHPDIINYITNSLYKKNILMMTLNHNQFKALLIDDLHIFITYDKSKLIKLYGFIKTITSNHLIIVVCDTLCNKHFNNIIKISYNLSLHKPTTKKINTKKINPKKINPKKINPKINTTIDKRYNVKETIVEIFKPTSLDNLFHLCLTEPYILSLNIIENTPLLKIDGIDTLYKIYKSICISDNIETKYYKLLDIDIIILFSCIYPRYHIFNNTIINKDLTYKYNSYISKSIIQIYNQSLLKSFNYIDLLDLIIDIDFKKPQITNKIKTMITDVNYLFKSLEKQLKVYNYFNNLTLTKKDITNILINI